MDGKNITLGEQGWAALIEHRDAILALIEEKQKEIDEGLEKGVIQQAEMTESCIRNEMERSGHAELEKAMLRSSKASESDRASRAARRNSEG